MATTRVKESCLPCRRRKTRCDDAQPCSSCVLRKTQADCRPAGSSNTHEVAQLDARDAESRRRGTGSAPRDTEPTRSFSGGSRMPDEVAFSRRPGPEEIMLGNGSSKRRRLSPDRSLDTSPRTFGVSRESVADDGVTLVQTGRALDEVGRLRASILALEKHCLEMDAAAQAAAQATAERNARRLASLDGDATSPGGSSYKPVSPEDRQRWETLWAALPDLGSCEILLEYLVQECDFLYTSGNVVHLWLAAARTRSISKAAAAKLAVAFATSALLLGHGSHPYYRPKCNPVALNVSLWELSQGFLANPVNTLEEVEVAVDYFKYLVYSGRHAPLNHYGAQPYLSAAIRLGLLDESHPSWFGLSEEERDWKRQVATDLIMNTRWGCLSGPKDPLVDVRVNVCMPTFAQKPLDVPIRTLSAQSDPACIQAYADQSEPDFRLFRVKSLAERQRTQTYKMVMSNIAEILPRIKQLHQQLLKVDSNDASEVEALAIRSANLNDELVDWQNRKLPQAGWPVPTAEDVNPTDMARCKRASQAVSLHNAITFLQAGVLRPWLTAGIQGQRHDSIRKRLHDDCLRNADRIMQSLPVIKALLATRTQPVITPWAACVCFIAAMTYAVPLLRAVQKLMAQPSGATEEDIRRLPTLPDSVAPHSIGRTADSFAEGEDKPIPAFLFGDNEVRTCANNILKVLDILSILRVSPLGASAEAKVRKLTRKYNLASPEHSPGQLHEGSMAYELPSGPSVPAGGLASSDGLNGLAENFSSGGIPDMRHQSSVDQGASALLQLANNGHSVPLDSRAPPAGPSASSSLQRNGARAMAALSDSPATHIAQYSSFMPSAAEAPGGGFELGFDSFFPPAVDPLEAYFGFQPGLAAGSTNNPVVLEQLFTMDNKLWENWLDPLPTPQIQPPQL